MKSKLTELMEELNYMYGEDDVAEEAAVGTFVYIPLCELHPHPDNPRKELGDLSELAESIKAKGIMQNLTVVPRDEGGYTVIIGHRRSEAARQAGLEVAPCVITQMSESEQVATMLLENMQRVDLTAYEQAQGMQLMMDLGETVESISEKTGFSKKTVKHRLEMAKLNAKTLKDVSERQVSMADFDKLAKIKDIKKRNEVLEKIGTANFDSAVEVAMRAELIAERLPSFIQKVEALSAKKMKDADRWSSKYERVADIDVKIADADKPLVQKKYQKEPIFYAIRENFGYLEIYRKRPKEATKKRPKEEIERERAIEECKKGLKAATEMARVLRGNFVKGLAMHSKNREQVLAGGAAVLKCSATSYLRTVNAEQVLEFIGEKTSNEYGGNGKLFESAFLEKPQVVIPALIYLSFENDGVPKYWTECYNGFPEHTENVYLDELYAWLISLGYEMSDDERALMDGTHELFKKEEQA